MERQIEIKLIVDNIDTEIEVSLWGTVIKYLSNYYILSVHCGLPIKRIMIRDKLYTDYIISAWNDLIVIPLSDPFSETFVFTQFVKKQMTPVDRIYINNNVCKFMSRKFLPINMIPNNPTIMYNIIKSTDQLDEMSNGLPVYINMNKLFGIVSKNEDKTYYIIPIQYILKTLTKKDNTKIYKINELKNNINKVSNYKLIGSKIYCNLHKCYITLSTYEAVHGDMNINIKIITKDNLLKTTNYIEFINREINNNIIIDIKDNIIKMNSAMLHILKILNEYDIIAKYFDNMENITYRDNYIIVK